MISSEQFFYLLVSLKNKIMEKSFTYVGIDISKLTFDIAIFQSGKYQYYKFENETKGFKAFLKLLSASDCCVMEASGPYYLKLACFLFDKAIAVSVVHCERSAAEWSNL
ncbi:hypothetical protein AM493_02790 [Flavobacterium akiainvivens]|uniref:Uncharacterized protein n=2 Tax=Flavobacterium akiainvivens TaxID=1202724 RepID=A0A0M8MGG7_9FLAO|nr:hypothetical protein AM493_02790 [Flavobacterium akiainvivens]